MSDFDFDFEIGKEIEIEMGRVMKGFHKLQNLQTAVDLAVDRGMRVAANKIEAKLMNLLDDYDVPQLKSSAYVNPFGDGYMVGVDHEQAIFVEYGTGIRGMRHPHPESGDIGWDYDINSHGSKGWIAPIDDLGVAPENPYKKELPSGRLWTNGMPARPYFHDLIQWVQKYGVITRAIRAELRKIR